MSHCITIEDTIAATRPCWHGLESIVSEIDLSNAGLDWDVRAEPIFSADMDEVPGYSLITAPSRDGTRRLPLQVSGEKYSIIQNEQVWDLLREGLRGVDYEVTAAGSLSGRTKIWFSVELAREQTYVVNRDEFRNHLTFVTSHDRSLALRCWDTSVRVVCQNTLSAALGDARGAINLRVLHTRGAAKRIDDLTEHLDNVFAKRDEFYLTLAGLAEQPMSEVDARRLFAGLVCADKPTMSSQARNRVERLTKLFAGEGIAIHGATAYDALNAWTQYWTREAVKANVRRSYASGEFGTGAARKAAGFAIIADPARRGDTMRAGAAVL